MTSRSARGAVWVGNSGVSPPYTTVSVSRIDPRTGRIGHTETLPDRTRDAGGRPSEGYPRIAVGAGAVWAANQDGTVSRLDPRTERRVAIVDVGVPVRAIAAGKEGVWFLDHGDHRVVTRIDERGNRRGQKIAVGTVWLSGIAVGAGSVWVTSPDDGQLWRIKPGSSPITQTIQVGEQVYVRHLRRRSGVDRQHDGARLAHRSAYQPRHRSRAARQPAGARRGRGLGVDRRCGRRAPTVSCRRDVQRSRVGRPDPRRADRVRPAVAQPGSATVCARGRGHPRHTQGARLPRRPLHRRLPVMRRHGRSERRLTRCAGAPRTRPRTPTRRAWSPSSARSTRTAPWREIAIANQAPGGPLALVSPSASRPGFTRGAPLLPPDVDRTGEPDVYYPTGQRNFFRLTARDDQLGIGADGARVAVAARAASM